MVLEHHQWLTLVDMSNMSLLVAEGALLLPTPPLQLSRSSSLHGHSLELAAGKRRSPSLPLSGPWSARANGVSLRRWPRIFGSCSSGHGDHTTPSPGARPGVENLLFHFYSVPPPAPQPVEPKISPKIPQKYQQIVSFLPRFQEGENNTVMINNALIMR